MTDFIKKHSVTAITFAIYVIVTWTLFGSGLETTTSRVDRLESNQRSEEVLLTDIQSRLASIETSIEFIKIQLSQTHE